MSRVVYTSIFILICVGAINSAYNSTETTDFTRTLTDALPLVDLFSALAVISLRALVCYFAHEIVSTRVVPNYEAVRVRRGSYVYCAWWVVMAVFYFYSVAMHESVS